MELKEELKEWDQCLSMLGEAKVDDEGNVSDTKDSNVMYLDKDCEDREINVSSIFLTCNFSIFLTENSTFKVFTLLTSHRLLDFYFFTSQVTT